MAHSGWKLRFFGIALGPGLMKIDIVDTWDTFDGFRIAFGGFSSHFLAPVIKVIHCVLADNSDKRNILASF